MGEGHQAMCDTLDYCALMLPWARHAAPSYGSSPRGRLRAEDVARLRASLDGGLAAIPRIALSYNGVGAGRSAECESYLRECVVYRFGDEEKRGLLEFYRRCHALGLTPRVPELLFHGHS